MTKARCEPTCNLRGEKMKRRRVLGLLVLFCSCLCVVSASATPKRERIIGGVTAPQGKWPYAVNIVFRNTTFGYEYNGCGGTLVASQWVLTAAHCVIDEVMFGPGGDRAHRVTINRADLNSHEGEDIPVAGVIVHPNYNYFTDHADIALIHLTRPSSTPVVPLASKAEWRRLVRAKRPPLQVIGWGLTEPDNPFSESSELRETTVKLRTKEQCNTAYPGQITRSMFCAGLKRGGQDSCQGDSGGGIFHNFGYQMKQVGIVSWGRGCALKKFPGVYTKSARFLKWISGITGRPL